MGNEIKVTLYKNVNNIDIDIKAQNSFFEKIKNRIKYIENTNYSMITSEKKEGFFTLIFNKIKSIFNIKKSVESCRNKISDYFYNQLNANAYLCKVKDINDITLDKVSMMDLFFKLDNNNNHNDKSEIISSFVKRNVKTKADLILIDKLLNGYKNLDKINFRDFVGEKFHVDEIVNLFNIITLDVNNDINNNVFLFIINSCLREKGDGCFVTLVDDILKSIKYNKYSFEISNSLFNKVVKTINIGKFVSELKVNLGIKKELIEKIIDDAFQKYSNADNYVKTQEAWINTLYNKKENSKIVYNINKNRMLITQRIEEIVNSLDDDEMIIGMPQEQYIIRMEQILDIFSAIQAG
ncbi:hypothetical protein [Proteus sp. ZN5]|uniref:hypothetical protein n=1 Tax=Proteus sp. ZN5 TaxID=2697019 RepID=UPI0013E1695C|nr:hypothetical protein [Proteus sp. ZN5]QIG04941.1 hypothetical protein GTK47_06150 [Proteus sp. ZN5]